MVKQTVMWKQVDNYYMKNGDWTIERSRNVPKPFGLWQNNVNIGYFEKLEQAKEKYEQLTSKSR